MAENKVPIINIKHFKTGNGIIKEEIANELDYACRKIGFFAIVGHGVSETIMSRTRAKAEEFFNLPESEKVLVERPPQKVSRGYNKLKDRSLSYSLGLKAPPDLQEAFAFGPEEIDGSRWIPENPETAMLAPNRWPEFPTDFKKVMLEYDTEMRALGERMLDIIAVALDTDRQYFRTKFNHQSSVARMVRYPAQEKVPEKGQLRAGVHSDYGTLTFLRGDPVPGGTQILLKNGKWLDVKTPENGFVCNIGDALARWTNDRWVSTLHRVGNPPSTTYQTDRISMVYFHSPNHDAIIDCLPSCRHEKAKYPPVTFAQHYLNKVMKAAHARKSASVIDAKADK